jgi:protein phosphatase PTC7
MAAASSATSASASQLIHLQLDVGHRLLPHPDKAARGGEDAILLAGRIFGVFDGVGGWAEQGIDAGIFSRELATRTAAVLRSPGFVARAVGAALSDALAAGLSQVSAVGSSTACLVHIDAGGQLSALNVGDSGLRVFRCADASGGARSLVLASAAQQHEWNFPYQLGTGSRSRPADGDAYRKTLRRTPGGTRTPLFR